MQERQAEAYQARLRKVKARLKARLREKQQRQAGRDVLASPPSFTEPKRPPIDPPRAVGFARPRLSAARPNPRSLFQFLLLVLTLFNVFPVVGGEMLHPLPAPPEFDPGPGDPLGGTASAASGMMSPPEPSPASPSASRSTASAGAPTATGAAGPLPDAPVPGGPAAVAPPAPLANHAQYVADQTAQFNQTLARALAKAPSAGIAIPAAGTPPDAPMTIIPERVAQALAQAGNAAGAAPPLAAAASAQLAGLEGMAAGLQTVLSGFAAEALSPEEATDLVKLASATILNIVNSFRVAAQTRALGTFPPELERIRAEREQIQGRLLAGTGMPKLGALMAASAGAEPASGAKEEKACCDYADLMAQYGIQQVLGAAGATNVAAYIIATEAAAELVGVDVATAANTTLPAAASGLPAAADLTAAAAGALAATVLVPVPGAAGSGAVPALDPAVWANTSAALASRCGAYRCWNPVTEARAEVAGLTLAGSVLNLVGYILYSASVQLALVMEGGNGTWATVPGATLEPGAQMVWINALMGNFQRQALAAVPPGRMASVLATLPVPSGTGFSPFPEITPWTGDPEALRSVLEVIGRSIQSEDLPALAGIPLGSAPPASGLAGMLSGLQRLASAGMAQRALAAPGTRTPASEFQWQRFAVLANCTDYALATAQGYRTGLLDRATATVLLTDLADTLQALVYGFLIEASAVPVEVSNLFRQGAIPQLTRARAKALGLDGPAGSETERCRDCCRLAELGNQEAAQEIGQAATRTYLAAYIEALVGSIITEVLDGVALAGAAPARNGTGSGQAGAPVGMAQVASAGNPASAQVQAAMQALAPAGSPAPGGAAASGSQAPAAGSGSRPAPEPRLAADCANCACDLAFSRQQVALAEMTRSGGGLTLLAYTLNLVVKGLQIELAAQAAD
jgi:hypothetical protein